MTRRPHPSIRPAKKPIDRDLDILVAALSQMVDSITDDALAAVLEVIEQRGIPWRPGSTDRVRQSVREFVVERLRDTLVERITASEAAPELV